MGLFDKMMGMGTAKSAKTKDKIRELFDSCVEDGESYATLGAFYMTTTKKLMKEIRTYYNYIIGYRDGEDPEIVVIPTEHDLGSIGEPVLCKLSQCQKTEYRAGTAEFYIQHPALEDGEVAFSLIVSTMWAGYIIDVSYVDEFTPFAEFFQNRFAK